MEQYGNHQVAKNANKEPKVMITSQEIAEVLKAHSKKLGTSQITVEGDGAIWSCLQNRLHPSRPHTLRIYPPDEKDTLRICVAIMAEHRMADAGGAAMFSFRTPFESGYLKLDSKDGITYEFSESLKTRGIGPSAESIGESLRTVVEDLRRIEMLILHAQGLVHAASRMLSVDDGHEWPNP